MHWYSAWHAEHGPWPARRGGQQKSADALAALGAPQHAGRVLPGTHAGRVLPGTQVRQAVLRRHHAAARFSAACLSAQEVSEEFGRADSPMTRIAVAAPNVAYLRREGVKDS